jgi:type IV pilus assembly protein PilW
LSLNQSYRSDAAVYQLETHHYYVAPASAPAGSSRAGTLSLWRYIFPPPAGKTDPYVEELAAGIDQLAISYGVAAPNALDPSIRRTTSRYVSAQNVGAGNWDLVVAVRLQVLASTSADGMSRTFQVFSFAGSSVTATDKRLHNVLTEVVTLRNHAQ